MSRKNPFANLDIASISGDQTGAKPGYGMTGAAKTVVRSIEEMAANTKRLMDGETIVELEPALLDVSPVADRLSAKDEDYIALREAIQEHGQSTPILVRPHPEQNDRYIVVFGHRRVRVAQDLGIKVKAVIKKLDDIASAIAQGQENSARANLSFIERAYFARNLIASGMTKDVVKSSLGIDDAMLSRMLSVIETVPSPVLLALGASKKIGRDKWLSLRQLILKPAYRDVAINHVATSEFLALPQEDRFDALHAYLKKYRTRSVAKTPRKEAAGRSWMSPDNSVSLVMNTGPRKVAIELSNSGAKPFGEWLSASLDRLYDEYKLSVNKNDGD